MASAIHAPKAARNVTPHISAFSANQASWVKNTANVHTVLSNQLMGSSVSSVPKAPRLTVQRISVLSVVRGAASARPDAMKPLTDAMNVKQTT